jgi:D-alanyl-D-alanine carboxypeptidase/D-alanyl-D-alanine-endopeptidase (penicillin-binding protein 4)
VLGAGSAVVAGQAAPPAQVQWFAGINTGPDAAVLAGLDTQARQPSRAGLAGVVNPLLADGGLGGRVTASIVDVATGQSLFELAASEPATPASTAKLLTAAAVLHSRGPTYQIPTRVVAGAAPGEVVLIGGGDPTLAAGGHQHVRVAIAVTGNGKPAALAPRRNQSRAAAMSVTFVRYRTP